MIRYLIDSSLKFPLLIAGLVLAMFAAGYAQLRDTPVDVLPDFAPVYVEVQTESLGLSAVEVEQLITAPMEQLLLNGVPFLEDVESESIPGLSSITLIFEPGTDPLEARQVVQERVAQGRDLPKVARAPVMLQPLSSTSRVMMVRVDSAELSPIDQSILANWTIKPALMGVPGVANVAIWGEREQQMQVQVDPELLEANGVTLSQVMTTAANSLWVSPLTFVEASTPGTGGFIDTPNQRLGVQHILPITEPDHLASVALEGANGEQVLGKDGKPVLLGDVVSVVQDHQPLIGDAVGGDSQGLVLAIEKFPDANTLEVTNGIDATLAELAPGLSGVEFNTEVFRPASFIDMAIDNLAWVLLLGLLLVVVVLALFAGWRVALIGAVTLPLSLVSAALVLALRGETMNMMLLAGMVVAIAAIIDDTVIDFDNVRRRLRENREAGRRATLISAVQEMRRPMAFATLIMLAATVLLFYVGFRSGLDAAFFLPSVLSYLLALLASWVITLTVAPVLAMALLRGQTLDRGDAPIARRMRKSYGSVLSRGFARPVAALAAFGLIAIAGLAVAPLLDADMKPDLKERALLIHWEAAPGTSHPEMSRITSRVTEELRTVSGVSNVGAHVGRALTSDEITNVNSGEVWVALATDADHDEAMAAVQDVVAGYPGIEQEVLTYTQERVDAYGVGTRAPDDVVVRVFGQDFDVLAEKAEEIRSALAGAEGAGTVTVGTQPEEAQIEVQVDLAAAQRFNLTPGEVRRAAATLVSGITVGSLFEEQKVFQVVVLGTPETRHDLSLVRDLRIDAPGGKTVRLADVADVRITSVPTTVRHNAVSRYVDVTADVTDGSVADFAERAEEVLESIAFPLEYHAEIQGDYALEQATATQLLGFGVGALVAIFLLFQAYLRSWKLAAVSWIGLPLAVSGGMLAAAVTGIGLDLGALLGVLVVVGIYTRNVLTLFGGYRRLAPPDGSPPDLAVVVHGAQARFLPTVTTAVAVAAALVPVLAFGSRPGLELIHSMAVVVLGGLVTSTVLNLFVLPLSYLHTAPDHDTAELDTTDARSSESELEVAVR